MYAGIFLTARLPQLGLTLVATQRSTSHSAKDSSTQQTSFRRLECTHTGQARKPHGEHNSSYAGLLPGGQASSARLHVNVHTHEHHTPSKESSSQQTSFRRLECRHTGQARKPHGEHNSSYAGLLPDGQSSSTRPQRSWLHKHGGKHLASSISASTARASMLP